jgi:hypothetical protein
MKQKSPFPSMTEPQFWETQILKMKIKIRKIRVGYSGLTSSSGSVMTYTCQSLQKCNIKLYFIKYNVCISTSVKRIVI